MVYLYMCLGSSMDTCLLHDWLCTSYFHAWMASYLWLTVCFLWRSWPFVPRDSSCNWCWPWLLYHYITRLHWILYPAIWTLPTTISLFFPTWLFSCVGCGFIIHARIWFLFWWWCILPTCFLLLAWSCSLLFWDASMVIISLLDCGLFVDSFSVGLWVPLLGCANISLLDRGFSTWVLHPFLVDCQL